MDKQEAKKILKEFHDTSALFSVRTALETVFPELKEDEDELEWLKQFIQEEAYTLSMDIRDDEDSFRLKKLQKSLEWLEKQGERIKLLLNKKGENVQDLIEKYVSDHAANRWLDASELEKLLNNFVLEYDVIKNGEYEQQCKVSNNGNNR